MDKEPRFLFGINPVAEKLKASPHEVSEILIARGSSAPALRGLDAQGRRLGIRVKYVIADLLDRLSEGQRHQGGVAEVRAYSYSTFADLLQAVPSKSRSILILVLGWLTESQN